VELCLSVMRKGGWRLHGQIGWQNPEAEDVIVKLFRDWGFCSSVLLLCVVELLISDILKEHTAFRTWGVNNCTTRRNNTEEQNLTISTVEISNLACVEDWLQYVNCLPIPAGNIRRPTEAQLAWGIEIAWNDMSPESTIKKFKKSCLSHDMNRAL
jgi:hypothetical protein